MSAKPKTAKLKIVHMRLKDLKPHPRNPRVHGEPGSAQWETLKASLAHDFFDPLVFNKRNGMLVSGHFRRKVLMAEKYVSVDVVVVDYPEDVHIARMIAANKNQGEDDRAALKDLLLELDDGAFDMALAGYDMAELEKMMTAVPPEDAKDQDESGGDGKSKRVTCPECGKVFEP